MVLTRDNPQAKDAIALTQRAIDRARDIGRESGHVPEVTVTGHSLGGTLAQITAHYFGLRGETFNAYGAAGLGERIGGGGDNVINHVMAGDTVSAASSHFGQVRVYASAHEIAGLHAAGYANDRNPLDPRAPAMAAGALAGSHGLHHFLNEDGDGRPDRSVLADPAARHLAAVFDPMIDRFRLDVEGGRFSVTTAARGPVGNLLDAVEELRGPLPAGMPAARAQHAAAEQAQDLRQRADYHAQRQSIFRERLPAIEPTGEPPDLLRQPDGQGRPAEASPFLAPDYLRMPSPRDADASRHDWNAPSSDTRSPRSDHPHAFPADHPHYPLYAALEARLPGVARVKLAEITQQAVQGGVTAPRQLRHVGVHEDQVWVMGHIPGDRANVSLSVPPPSLPDTLREMAAFDQQQTLQRAQFHEQQNAINRDLVPGMGGRLLI